MKKLIVVFMGLGMVGLACVVWLNPNPDWRKYAVYDLEAAAASHDNRGVVQLTAEWNAQYGLPEQRPDLAWGGAQITQKHDHWIRAGVDDDRAAVETVLKQIESK